MGEARVSTKPSRDEIALIARLRSGDEGAFADLIETYHARMTRFALLLVENRSVAEEVVQETWLGVVTGLADFEGRSSLKSWIFRILTNRATTRAARERRAPVALPIGEAEPSEIEPAVDPTRFRSNGTWAVPPDPWTRETPERALMREEFRSALERAIGELPANQRIVLVLRDMEGIGPEDVCNILGVAETNQRVLLHRARSRVRRFLESYFGQVEPIESE